MLALVDGDRLFYLAGIQSYETQTTQHMKTGLGIASQRQRRTKGSPQGNFEWAVVGGAYYIQKP
jgi:hypothetical protein